MNKNDPMLYCKKHKIGTDESFCCSMCEREQEVYDAICDIRGRENEPKSVKMLKTPHKCGDCGHPAYFKVTENHDKHSLVSKKELHIWYYCGRCSIGG